jgi:uncharacterized protein YqeY
LKRGAQLKIQTKISDDIKAAMKAQDRVRSSVLRMVLADLKNARVQGDAQKDLTEAEEIAVVSKYLKKLEKALPDYEGTPKKEEILNEMKIVQDYLPTKASAEEVEKLVDQVLASTAERNFGKLMKMVMEPLGQGADGKVVSEILKKKMGS